MVIPGRRRSVAEVLSDFVGLVNDFEAGQIHPLDIPSAVAQTESSAHLDAIERALFLGEVGEALTPVQEDVRRRQWAAFRMARLYGDDHAVDVAGALRYVSAGVLLNRPDHLRLATLIDLIDPPGDGAIH